MVERHTRVAQFIGDRSPEVNCAVQILCEDHNGTYTPPFLCVWTGTAWISATTSAPIDTIVLGWRDPPDYRGPNRPVWAHRLSALRARR